MGCSSCGHKYPRPATTQTVNTVITSSGPRVGRRRIRPIMPIIPPPPTKETPKKG